MTTIALNLPDALAPRLRDHLAREAGAPLECYVLGLIAAVQDHWQSRDHLQRKIIVGLQNPVVPIDQAF